MGMGLMFLCSFPEGRTHMRVEIWVLCSGDAFFSCVCMAMLVCERGSLVPPSHTQANDYLHYHEIWPACQITVTFQSKCHFKQDFVCSGKGSYFLQGSLQKGMKTRADCCWLSVIPSSGGGGKGVSEGEKTSQGSTLFPQRAAQAGTRAAFSLATATGPQPSNNPSQLHSYHLCLLMKGSIQN